MAQEELRAKATLDTKDFEAGAEKLQRASKKVSKTSGSANQAIINLARGASDAKFGFAGLANNLEFTAESFGHLTKSSGGVGNAFKQLGKSLLGPTGVIAAVVLLISYAPHILSFFKSIVGASDEASNALDKFYKAQAAAAETPLQKENKLAQARIDEIDTLIAKQEKLRKLKVRGQKSTETIDDKISSFNLEKSILSVGILNRNTAKETKEEEKKKLKLFREQLKVLKDQEDIAENTIPSGNEDYFAGSDKKSFNDTFSVNPNEVKIVDPDDIYYIDEFTDALDDLESALVQTGSAFAGLSVDEAKQKFKDIAEAQKDAAAQSKEWSDALVGALNSAASQGGNLLENLAKGIFSALGSILIKKGVAAIFAGIADNAIVPGSGSKSITKGGLVVAAGIALKAGANLAKPSGTGSSAGGGGAQRSTPTATTTTPTSIQGLGLENNVIGVLRGQDIRLINQRANDSYEGLS